MRGLKFAILGIINRHPCTGYDITKKFNDSLSKFWDAKHSQIYPELKRLVDDGFVEYSIEIQGEKLEKKVYTITDKGRDALRDWLNTDEEMPPVPKDTFRLRMFFSDNLSLAEQADLCRGQREKRVAHIKELELRRAECVGAGMKDVDNFSEVLVIEGGLYRERAYVAWIDHCMDMLGCGETT